MFQPHTPPLNELVCRDWPAPAPPWLCPLSGTGLIRVSGKDAFDFLNNQLSNDLKKVSGKESQFSGYCSPKGRLYCTFRIFMRGDDYYLRTTADVADAVGSRLRRFVLRSDVTLDEEAALGGIGLIGPDGARLLGDAGLPAPAPAAVSGVAHNGECSVIRSPGVCERYEIYAPHSELATVWDALAPGASLAAGDVWRLYDVLSGIPNIYPQTGELFVPQMVNLDLTGGVSFSKGCYPGQEIVARTHYLGKLKRRMYRFTLANPPAELAPGDAVFVPAYSSEQPSGEIVDACTMPDGTLEGLASLRIRGLEQGEIHLGAPDGASGHIQPLPYEVIAESQSDGGNRS